MVDAFYKLFPLTAPSFSHLNAVVWFPSLFVASGHSCLAYPEHVVSECSWNYEWNKDRERGRVREKVHELRRLFQRELQKSEVMSLAPSLSRLLHSSLLPSPRVNLSSLSPRSTPPRKIHGRRRLKTAYPAVKALDLDQNTIIAITVGIASVGVGIGIPIFYESQIDSAAKRENKQACFPCNGTGQQQCRFCGQTGTVTVALGAGETEISRCINCDGAGTITCTTCQGTGIQPRYLDRREFKDDD